MKKYNVYIPLLLAIAMIAGIFAGHILTRKSQSAYGGVRLAASNKLNAILELIDRKYVDTVDTKEIMEKTIPDLLKNLDPHSGYIPAKYMQEVEEEMQGNFSGIGVRFFIREDTVVISDVISGGPSQNVGVMAGDRIVMVDDTLIAGVGMKDKEVMKLLRGIKGTKVSIKNFRRGFSDLFEFEITRGDILLTSVDASYMIDDETGFIKIERFSEQTYFEFKTNMDKLIEAGATKVILDLRNNQGGSLPTVIRMVDEFLEKDEPILITRGKSQPERVYNASARDSYTNIGVIILINEFSASASEIMAGAIQDNDRGIIVGRRSFGKGLVQEQIPFSDGSAVRMTIARYYTPSGRCIQKSYEEGNDKYSEDLDLRILHGEMFSADSIHFVDSLKYYTKSGRVVYGGGGIMPDFFVPADTTGRSDYYTKIYQKGLSYQFAFQYADQNRETLKKMETAKAIEKWLDEQNIMAQFVKYAENKGIPYSSEGMRLSGEIIETQVKANIAQNIIGENGFYPIIQKIDKTLLKAIDISHQNLTIENLTQNTDN